MYELPYNITVLYIQYVYKIILVSIIFTKSNFFSSLTWSSLPTLNLARLYHSMGVVNGKRIHKILQMGKKIPLFIKDRNNGVSTVL